MTIPVPDGATMRTLFLEITGTKTTTLHSGPSRITWTGSFDPKAGITTLIGRLVDPHALDRWADDGGAA